MTPENQEKLVEALRSAPVNPIDGCRYIQLTHPMNGDVLVVRMDRDGQTGYRYIPKLSRNERRRRERKIKRDVARMAKCLAASDNLPISTDGTVHAVPHVLGVEGGVALPDSPAGGMLQLRGNGLLEGGDGEGPEDRNDDLPVLCEGDDRNQVGDLPGPDDL